MELQEVKCLHSLMRWTQHTENIFTSVALRITVEAFSRLSSINEVLKAPNPVGTPVDCICLSQHFY